LLESRFQRTASVALNGRGKIIASTTASKGEDVKSRTLKFRLHTPRIAAYALLLRSQRSSVTRTKGTKLRAWWPLVAVCSLPVHLTAQDIDLIETELAAEVLVEVVDAANRRLARYVPATVLSQGDVVYYTLHIRNPTAEYLRNVAVKQRIPANTVYVENSASGPGAEVLFSIDGGQTFARSKDLRETDASGVVRPVPVEQYTHIQWRLRNALAPGTVALARFQAIFQ
jgi:uncharacterized repeat protein (TIGR01451 family)